MRKIAILTRLNATDVCAGCGCMNAFFDRKAHFARYQGEEARLTAFMRCSRCMRGGNPLEDAGAQEKLERLVKEGTQVAHIGVCAGRDAATSCPAMNQMAQWLMEHGIDVVWGTH